MELPAGRKMSLLEDAIQIAVAAHRGQRDKNGAEYILHPLRVMFRLRNENEMIVAILHDVVEDSDWTIEALRGRGFPEEILAAVDALTRRSEETYEQFVDRAAAHPLARRVKLADLEDNMDARRMREVGTREAERLNRYLAAWRKLTADR
jgi:(p)ppGpp synthase/HD superfamily hydrolase